MITTRLGAREAMPEPWRTGRGARQTGPVPRLGSAARLRSRGQAVTTATNAEVEIHYEAFGTAGDPTLLLVNGLGSQCINYDDDWCEKFAAQGFAVVRFDNRDTGLSSKLDGVQYTLARHGRRRDRGARRARRGRAHVMGVSMGGMIVQRLAIDHADRLLSMTSVMSRTGEPEYGQSSPEALAVLTRKPAASRDEYVDTQVAALQRVRLEAGVARRSRPPAARRARRTTAATTRPASRARCRRSWPTDRAPTRCARCASRARDARQPRPRSSIRAAAAAPPS